MAVPVPDVDEVLRALANPMRRRILEWLADPAGWRSASASSTSRRAPGYGVSGAIEELTERQSRHQIEVNLFGALWVTQAALPILRGQGSGWIVPVSSMGGLAAFPLTGIYHASKWALEGFSETLRQEVEPFGVRVLMVEPSGFRTDWAGGSMTRAEPIAAYEGVEVIAKRRASQQEDNNGSQPGNPDLAAAALLRTLDDAEPPFRLLLGNLAYDVAIDRYESRLEEFRAGEAVARGADDR